jgi:hypothetical protein
MAMWDQSFPEPWRTIMALVNAAKDMLMAKMVIQIPLRDASSRAVFELEPAKAAFGWLVAAMDESLMG